MQTFTVPSASMAKPVRAFNDAEADEESEGMKWEGHQA